MAEGEILVHGDVEEVGEVGDGDGAVGPGAGAVDFVVGLALHSDCLGDMVLVLIMAMVGGFKCTSDGYCVSLEKEDMLLRSVGGIEGEKLVLEIRTVMSDGPITIVGEIVTKCDERSEWVFAIGYWG